MHGPDMTFHCGDFKSQVVALAACRSWMRLSSVAFAPFTLAPMSDWQCELLFKTLGILVSFCGAEIVNGQIPSQDHRRVAVIDAA
jgi:hypothetical protein